MVAVRYPNPDSRSAALFSAASGYLTDGGSRSTIRIAPYSIYARSAQGKYVTDVDGNRLFDFNGNYTSMIHGHAHPDVVAAAITQIERGTGYSFGSEAEFDLARLLCERAQNFQKVRFMNSGTEAVMQAIKAARAYTDRPLIAKCENAYHGSYDFAEVSLGVAPTTKGDPPSRAYSSGTPQAVLDNVIVIPFNQPAAARRILDANAERLAGVMLDPLGIGMSRQRPDDAFLSMVEDFCVANGAVYIADEVVAFRAGPAGVQGDRGLRPQLTVLGKIIGGGFPIGAVAGSAEVMSVFEADDGRARLPHGGTYNANPVSMAAGHAAMRLLTSEAYEHINALGQAFRSGISDVLELTGVSGTAEGQYSIFALALDDPDLADTAPRGHVYRSAGLHRYMVEHGYWLSPGMLGVCSTIMTMSDVDRFCATLQAGIQALKTPATRRYAKRPIDEGRM